MHYRGGDRESNLKDIARRLRQEQTPAEAVLWAQLRAGRFLGYKFRRQHQMLQYVLDFYCHDLRLGIELDGPSHLVEFYVARDAARSRKIGMNGVVVIRFTNEEVLTNLVMVLATIHDYAKTWERDR